MLHKAVQHDARRLLGVWLSIVADPGNESRCRPFRGGGDQGRSYIAHLKYGVHNEAHEHVLHLHKDNARLLAVYPGRQLQAVAQADHRRDLPPQIDDPDNMLGCTRNKG